jgi:transglutaminase-like putative cysteine protease
MPPAYRSSGRSWYRRSVRTATKWTLGALAAGGAGLGLWWLSRRKSELADYLPGRMPMPPVIGRTSAGGMTTTSYRVGNGRGGLNQRLAVIQKMVEKGVNDPRMRKIALDATRHCPERDGNCEARGVYDAVKRRVRYTGDVAPIKLSGGGVEAIDYYQHPYRTWEIGGGDCDDQVGLIATMLSLNGITSRLRVSGQSRSDDGSHIYPLALLPKYDPKKAIVLDATLPGNRYGVEAPRAWVRDYDA